MNVYAWLSPSERKALVDLNGMMGRLGRLLSRENECRGGSSRHGDCAKRGDTEKAELASEISEGAPSIDSALEASETAGDGSGPSMPILEGKLVEVMDNG